MLFPENKAALRSLVFEILSACRGSQGSRRSFHRNSWNWYMYGSNTSTQSKYNKIKPTIDRRTSFLYAPDQTRFWANLRKDEDDVQQFARIESVTDCIEDIWQESGLDMLFNEGVRWAQVNGSMIGGIFANLVVVPPQVAIVGAGRVGSQVVAHQGQPAVRRVLPLSLTFDHRVVTGGEAARFLMALKTDLERPS